jgi:hypothetical protein
MSMRRTGISADLTCRANQRHIDIIEYHKARAGKSAAGFSFVRCHRQRQFQFVEAVSLHFPQFVDGLQKGLTRRANHGHNDIIAKVLESPCGEIRGGLFR